jgi:chromosomal replication initiation ATPase DnaA
MDIGKIWKQCLPKIADKVSSISFDCWIKPLVFESFEDSVFVLLAESRAIKEQATNQRHFSHIESAIKELAPAVEKVVIIDAVEKEEMEAKTKPVEVKKVTKRETPQVNPMMPRTLPNELTPCLSMVGLDLGRRTCLTR